MVAWHNAIKADNTKIVPFVTHFEKELVDARKEIKIKGSLEKLASDLPGIVEHRFRQLQEIEAVMAMFETELKKIRSQKFRMFLEKYQRALSSTDAWKYVDGESDVANMCDLINEVALVRNQFVGITKGLDQKSYMLGHVVKLRQVGIEDATL